ncbi:MAG TPA: hypothetical protein VGN72_19135 [Tepidisphaeraceae bacterium]|jgi:hypothetical protein|nr:hypothetical protein [Tepidisphaeraceae bacterium]
MPPTSDQLVAQIVWLFVLAIPVSCVAWTVTHEEVFREPREFCQRKSQSCNRVFKRKFFYLFTCEYCFSHYVTILFIWLTGYRMLLDDWRGYVLAFFGVVWIANAYMSLFARLRVDIRSERAVAEVRAKEAEVKAKQIERMSAEPADRAATHENEDGSRPIRTSM